MLKGFEVSQKQRKIGRLHCGLSTDGERMVRGQTCADVHGENGGRLQLSFYAEIAGKKNCGFARSAIEKAKCVHTKVWL
jgi:hypothetical protein